MLARWIAWRWLLLALALALALIAVVPAARVDFDRSIENMFARDSELLRPYRRLKRVFGGNEIVLLVYADDQLMSADGAGIRRLAELSGRLRGIDGVSAVLSLAELNRVLAGMGTSIVAANDPLAASYREMFAGYTHSLDGRTAALVCMLDAEGLTGARRQAAVSAIREVALTRTASGQPGMIAGEPVMVVEGFRYVERDAQRLGWITLLLLGGVIAVCFRSLRWVAATLGVVGLALVLTRASLAVCGFRLSMVSSMLTAIITVVGVAAVVHVVVRYRDERLAGRPPRDALLAAGHRVAAPITWACITDAVGFAALMWSRIAPVRDFGIMMAVGSLMVLVAIALLVPGLVLLGARQVPQHRTWADGSLGRSLERLVEGVRRHPRLVGGTALLLAAVALAGVARLRVETDFTKNFRAGSPIVEAYAFIEQRMGGAGVWDIVLRAPERLDRDFLERVQELERRLRRLQREGQSQPALTKVISLADAVAASEASPLLSRLPGEARLQGMQLAMPTFSQAMLARDPDTSQRYLRIMLRSPERQSADEKKWLIDQVRRVTEECFPAVDGQVQADVTGFYVLLTHLIDSLIGDQWLCFAVAAAGVGLAMLLAFRSLPLALIALVPNTLPILLVLGTMGWSGLPVNMGTAMIAAVSLGLSVDSSIHYVMSYQRRLRELGEPYSALRAVQRTVGRAAVFSTLALVSGFSVLCLSQFLPTLYFGVLVSLSMLGGLLGNLVLLPLMLQWLVLRPTTRNGA